MSEANVEVIREMYEHWARGEFPATFFDPDVAHRRVGAQTPDMEGDFQGLEGLSRATAEYVRSFSDLRIEADEIIDVDDDRVLVLSRHTARGKLSGVPTESVLGDLFTLREGKVVSYVSYWDSAEAMKAAGLSK